MHELNNKVQDKLDNKSTNRTQVLLKEIKSLIFIIFIVCLVKSVFVANYTVPTGSMRETIEPGDKLIVSKSSYRIRVPFTTYTLFEYAKPQRGDVIVFIAPDAVLETGIWDKLVQFIFPLTYVKRLIGLPGDRIEVVDGFITVNGTDLETSITDEQKNKILFEGGLYKENLFGKEYNVRRITKSYFSDNMPTGEVRRWTVPEGHYFAVGDNRDESSDSRVWNFIPESFLLGKAKFIYLSFDWPKGWFPKRIRTERFGQSF
jgi:signal peptidase I